MTIQASTRTHTRPPTPPTRRPGQASRPNRGQGGGRRRFRNGKPLVALSVVATVTVFLAFPLLSSIDAPDRSKVALGGALLTMMGFVSLPVMAPSGVRISLATFRVGAWMNISFILQFGLTSFLWVVDTPQDVNRVQISWIPNAQMASAVGWLCVIIGYRLGSGLRFSGTRARRREAWRDRAISIRGVGLLMVLGVAGTAINIASNNYGFASDVTAQLNAPSPFTYMFALMGGLLGVAVLLASGEYARTRAPSWLLILVVALSISLLNGTFSGMKSALIQPFLAALLGFGMVRRRLPWKSLIATALAYLLIVAPFVYGFRIAIRQGSERKAAIDVITDLPGTIRESFDNAEGFKVESAFWRFSQVSYVAPVTELSPTAVPFRSPVELVQAPLISIVPRLVWPGKPVLDVGLQLTQEYYDSNTVNAAAITPFGDLYRHGGWLPLAFGSVVLGLLARVIDNLWRALRWPLGAILTLSTFFMMVRMELTMLEILYALPGLVFIMFISWWILRSTSDPKPGESVVPLGEVEPEAVEAAAAELESESGRNSIQALQTS